MYIGRQYGMFTLLLYLVNFKGVDRAIITEGFYSKTKLSPQEYIYTKVGGNTRDGLTTSSTSQTPETPRTG